LGECCVLCGRIVWIGELAFQPNPQKGKTLNGYFFQNK
jgi:hypothetical protein